MAKEGYKPTAGMQSAARRAIKLKEQGKAKALMPAMVLTPSSILRVTSDSTISGAAPG